MKVGSLFSGAGMLDLGLAWAGMETVFQVEIDSWNQHLLEKNFPGTVKFTDIRRVDSEILPRVDVLAGGFPCQPVSVAGKKRAQEDERWLWPEFARIIRGLRPKYILVENVPGLINRGLGEVLCDLYTLGYDAEWTTFPAAYIGSPHQRDRLWLVAYPNIKRWNGGTGSIAQENGRNESSNSSKSLADTKSIGMERDWSDWIIFPPAQVLEEIFRRYRAGRGKDQWAIEPGLGRLANGTPNRVHRLWSLGNGVVPQVAEIVGRLIIEADKRLAL